MTDTKAGEQLAEIICSDRAMRVLMVRIEAAPYLVALVECLGAGANVQLEVRFLERNRTQDWNNYLGQRMKVLPSSAFRAALELVGDMQRLKPDVLHVAGWGEPLCVISIVLGALFGVPVVVDSDTSRGSPHPIRRVLKRLLLPRLFRLVRHFAPGGTKQSHYIRQFGVSESRITPVGMTVDVDSIRSHVSLRGTTERRLLRAQLGVGEADILVLFVGRLVPAKGVNDLVAAYYQLDEQIASKTHLGFVGDGMLRDQVARLGAEDERIHYLGWLGGNELWAAYAAADLFVGPSWNENWGLVVNEAMAAGLPVLVSDCFGCIGDLVVHDKTGFIYPTRDVKSLALSITRVIKDVDLRIRVAREAERLISSWSLSAQAGRIHAVWQRVAEKRKGGI